MPQQRLLRSRPKPAKKDLSALYVIFRNDQARSPSRLSNCLELCRASHIHIIHEDWRCGKCRQLAYSQVLKACSLGQVLSSAAWPVHQCQWDTSVVASETGWSGSGINPVVTACVVPPMCHSAMQVVYVWDDHERWGEQITFQPSKGVEQQACALQCSNPHSRLHTQTANTRQRRAAVYAQLYLYC